MEKKQVFLSLKHQVTQRVVNNDGTIEETIIDANGKVIKIKRKIGF
jgi:hypothetical protein